MVGCSLVDACSHYRTLLNIVSGCKLLFIIRHLREQWTKSKTKHNNSITRIQQQEGPCSDDGDMMIMMMMMEFFLSVEQFNVQCSPFRVLRFQWRLIIANSVRMRFAIVLSPFPITQTNGTQFIAVLIVECFHHDNWHQAIIALKIGNKNRSVQFSHRTWSLNACYVHL